MPLRPYQQQCVGAAWAWIRKSVEPCVVEACTGAGKAHMIAALADLMLTNTGKHVLVLQPSAELVKQNREKYLLTGNPASIYSASAGGKSILHPVVFGTEGTVKGGLSRFGDRFGLVIIDECHRLTPTIRRIIERMRERNPRLRVIGLSATPYRLGEGYIYRMDENGRPVEHDPQKAYFMQRVACVTARELIALGFVTPPTIGAVADTYDTSGLVLDATGHWDADAVERAFVGQGRKTAAIIAEIVAKAQQQIDRDNGIELSPARKGVMIFASTVRHAHECLASLPKHLSAIITGETPKAERERIIAAFKARTIKYLVSVETLTTGFDAPHVDMIALLRKTESTALLQQIVGRGMRICEGKKDFTLLDYAENLEYHCPDGDIFRPTVRVKSAKPTDGTPITCTCPQCGVEQQFGPRPNPDGFPVNQHGYFCDLDHNPLPEMIPAHYGRRCQAWLPVKGGLFDQCTYRWTYKECAHCHADNDIAARYCRECKGELIDPNEKLVSDFKAMKKDPTQVQTDRVLAWSQQVGISRSGNKTVKVTYETPYRTFTVWYSPESTAYVARKAYERWTSATDAGATIPKTVTYRKQTSADFYETLDFNKEPDDEDPNLVAAVRGPRVSWAMPGRNRGTGNVLRPAAHSAS